MLSKIGHSLVTLPVRAKALLVSAALAGPSPGSLVRIPTLLAPTFAVPARQRRA